MSIGIDLLNLSNQFIVATPGLREGHFMRSVVYLYEHSSRGAFGLIINKPMDWELRIIFKHLNIDSKNEHVLSHPVLQGGPMGVEHGFILFPKKMSLPHAKESIKDLPEVGLSTSRNLLHDIAKERGKPDQFLITLGCAAWSPGQLEQEMQQNAWIVAPFAADLLFDMPFEERWEAAAAMVGVNFDKFSTRTGHA